jgi:hypothetical protein
MHGSAAAWAGHRPRARDRTGVLPQFTEGDTCILLAEITFVEGVDTASADVVALMLDSRIRSVHVVR